MELKNILVEHDDDITVITINRPEKLNALNNAVLNELDFILEELKSSDAKVIIITGSGDKAFIAGADIKELKECNLETGKLFAKKGQNIFNKIENLGKPVIAAINGYALGGGCELALACHLRIANSRVKLGQPEINLGIIPGYGGTQRLTRLINSGKAAEYILSGDLISAEDALDIGLINKITAPEDLIKESKIFAKKIASKSQVAVKAVLKAIQKTKNSTLEEGLDFEAELFSQCCGSDDFQEGTSAFLEKRTPVFSNK